MFNKNRAFPSEAPNLPNQKTSNPTGSRHFGKKHYATAAAVVAIIIIGMAFFVPQGQATIPLKVDYKIGEKMVYDNTITASLQSYNLGSIAVFQTPNSTTPNNITMNSQQTIEVIGFDGENFLLNHTIIMTMLNRPVSISMMEKMNQTGYSTYLLNAGNAQIIIPTSGPTGPTSDSFLAQLLNKPEVKVGDTITIPYPAYPIANSSIQTTGDLTIKFNSAEDLTVPAGTFKVFRIDMTSNNIKMTFNPPATNATTILSGGLSMSIDLNAQIYLEYGTMRQIKSTMQENSTYQSSMLNMTMQMNMDMTLKQHIKP
jgi:hypothetical protein